MMMKINIVIIIIIIIITIIINRGKSMYNGQVRRRNSLKLGNNIMQ